MHPLFTLIHISSRNTTVLISQFSYLEPRKMGKILISRKLNFLHHRKLIISVNITELKPKTIVRERESVRHNISSYPAHLNRLWRNVTGFSRNKLKYMAHINSYLPSSDSNILFLFRKGPTLFMLLIT